MIVERRINHYPPSLRSRSIPSKQIHETKFWRGQFASTKTFDQFRSQLGVACIDGDNRSLVFSVSLVCAGCHVTALLELSANPFLVTLSRQIMYFFALGCPTEVQ